MSFHHFYVILSREQIGEKVPRPTCGAPEHRRVEKKYYRGVVFQRKFLLEMDVISIQNLLRW